MPDPVHIWNPPVPLPPPPPPMGLDTRPQAPALTARIPFQKELCFDEELVLQQLRYTGMLETVRIRRSGYSAKYTFQVGCHAWLPTTQCRAEGQPALLPDRVLLWSMNPAGDLKPGLLHLAPLGSFCREGQLSSEAVSGPKEGFAQADPCVALPFIEHLLQLLYPTLLFYPPAAREPGSYFPDTETEAQGSSSLRDGSRGNSQNSRASNLTLVRIKLQSSF